MENISSKHASKINAIAALQLLPLMSNEILA
jgi:hypothetical protein